MKTRLTIFLLLFIALFPQAPQSHIPRPEKCVLGAGNFVLGGSPVVVCAETGLHGMADSLQAQLRSLGFSNGQMAGRSVCRLLCVVGGNDEAY